MAVTRRIYGEVKNMTGLRKVFTEIRRDVEEARSRPGLANASRSGRDT